MEMEHEEDEEEEPLEFVILESNTPIGKRKRCSRSTATVSPATSQHAVPEESVVQEDGVAYINVAISVPAGLRLGSTSVTVEWVPTP